MPARTATPPEMIDRIVQLAEAGCTSTEIIKQTGVSRTTVYKFARGKVKRAKTGHDWTREETQFLDDHYLVDMTAKEVGDALGLPRNCIKAKAYHIGIATTRSPLHIIKKDQLEKVIVMACAGAALADISAETGAAKQTILHHINKRRAIHRLWIRHAPERRSEAHRKVYQEGRGGFAKLNRQRREEHGAVRPTAQLPEDRPQHQPNGSVERAGHLQARSQGE